MIRIALCGNPNVGKTSIFNRLTRSQEHVGNWHGVTVDKKEKVITRQQQQIGITDLPGFYSMTVYSSEEGLSRDCILSGESDVIVNVCEVGNLARNLYLTLQLLELRLPVVLAVNMMDELEKRGKGLDKDSLKRILGIPVVATSAKYRGGADAILDAAAAQAGKNSACDLPYLRSLPLEKVKRIISKNAADAKLDPLYAAIKLLEKDAFVREKLNLSQQQAAEIEAVGDWQSRVAAARYGYIDSITTGIFVDLTEESAGESKANLSSISKEAQVKNRGDCGGIKLGEDDGKLGRDDGGKLGKIDRIVLNKYLALPVFLLVMLVIFVITFGLVGKWLSDLLDLLITTYIATPLTGWLINIAAPSWVVGLVADGIVGGVGGVLVFLPQITLLFLFLALLEDSGYISRVAFMTDGLFRKIGLSGRSVFTMLMGFGCSATAVLTARGLEDETMRKKTVLLTPFFSCSARLPVYLLLVSKFFGGNPLVIFALYIIGAAVALLLAAVMQKIRRLKSGRLSFVMEMPPYRMPTFERVFHLIWHNVKTFLVRVGTVVFCFSVIVWVLSSFSFANGFVGGGELSENSIMAMIGRVIAPVFSPLGFGNWRAVTALLSGLVAKEVILSTISGLGGLDMIFAGGNVSLTAFCFLLFVLFYTPCFATLAATNKEIGAKWTAFGFALQLAVAYLSALLARGVGLLLIHHTAIAVTVIVLAVVALVGYLTVRNFVRARRSGGCYGCGGCNTANKSGKCNKSGDINRGKRS